MIKCGFCEEDATAKCGYCDKLFCRDHRLPPRHECKNLDIWIKAGPPGIRIGYDKNKVSTISPTGQGSSRFFNPKEEIKKRKKRAKIYKLILLAGLIVFLLLLFILGAW